MGDSRIKDISSLLSSFFSEENLIRGEHFTNVFSSWTSIVGQRLAAHSRVTNVEKNLLVVEADHPGWIQLLQLRQSSILENVVHRYPELGLRGIIFRLVGQSPPVFPESGVISPKDPTPISDSDGEKMSQQLEKITDPEFKALFAELKKAIQGKS
jgi:hypothetical protein